MANSTLTTGGGVALNDKVNYWVNSIDIGKVPRAEYWLKPQVRGAVPQLALGPDDAAQMTIHLAVVGSSVSNLQTLLETVRNEFVSAANTLTWTIAGGTSKTIVTYASPIDPVNLSNTVGGGTTYLAVAANNFRVLDWAFTLWRSPYYSSSTDAANFRTPAM